MTPLRNAIPKSVYVCDLRLGKLTKRLGTRIGGILHESFVSAHTMGHIGHGRSYPSGPRSDGSARCSARLVGNTGEDAIRPIVPDSKDLRRGQVHHSGA